MLTTDTKQQVIKEHQRDDSDTGSSEVQIAILTKRIEELTDHLRTHRKDNHSRRGLIKMVSKRKKLLKYLAKTDRKMYEKVTSDLGLKK